METFVPEQCAQERRVRYGGYSMGLLRKEIG
jgi:hypothetical protein